MSEEIMLGTERRNYVRLEKALPLKYRIKGDAQDKIYDGVTRNISHGGLCIEPMEITAELKKELKSKTKPLEISINLDDSAQTSVPAASSPWIQSKVEWIRESADLLLLGVAFENLDDDSREKIHVYIVSEFVKHYGA
jgi:c-di-GMP-binding flagellar brake protein YcgR